MSITGTESAEKRILAAASQLFGDYGYDKVSLRQITAQAGVNLAAVNYHFYDKETLFLTVLKRHLRTTNEFRIELLEAAERSAVDGFAPLPAVVDALARPLFLPKQDSYASSSRFPTRLLIERLPFTEPLRETEFQPVMTRFGHAMRRHAPSLPPQDFLWRLSFIVGALHHSILTLNEMTKLTQGICRSGDAATALDNFTGFAVAALR